MTPEEYRIKHPSCKYCQRYDDFIDKCSVSKEYIYYQRRAASKCRMYLPEEYIENTYHNPALYIDHLRQELMDKDKQISELLSHKENDNNE